MVKTKEKIVIIGDSAFAEVACEYFTYDSEYQVAGFSVEKAYLKRETLFGLPVVPFESVEKIFPPDSHKAFVAIVYTQLNRLRERLYLATKKKGYSMVSYISSHAFVWRNVTVGENSFIFEDKIPCNPL